MKENKVNQMTLCAILVSMALVLSYIEHFIPLQMFIPMPGVKLGLANIVTLMALFFLGTKSAFIILILRCILGAVFGGGISGLAFSLTGGIFAMTIMCMFKHCRRISIYGVSVLGAAAHNIGQILVAVLFMESVYVVGYLPYLLLVSVFTGLATGSICAGVFRILKSNRKNISGEELCFEK